MSQLNLSARVYRRILKLVRKIADLAESAEIQSTHLAEALHTHLHCNNQVFREGVSASSGYSKILKMLERVSHNDSFFG